MICNHVSVWLERTIMGMDTTRSKSRSENGCPWIVSILVSGYATSFLECWGLRMVSLLGWWSGDSSNVITTRIMYHFTSFNCTVSNRKALELCNNSSKTNWTTSCWRSLLFTDCPHFYERKCMFQCSRVLIHEHQFSLTDKVAIEEFLFLHTCLIPARHITVHSCRETRSFPRFRSGRLGMTLFFCSIVCDFIYTLYLVCVHWFLFLWALIS
jgi:hypothetical protein